MSAIEKQTLSGRGARVYWLRVVTGISAASTGGVLVFINVTAEIIALDARFVGHLGT